jgi:hypothetical protein
MNHILKKLLWSSILVIAFLNIKAQVNLIADPSFEDTAKYGCSGVTVALKHWKPLDSARLNCMTTLFTLNDCLLGGRKLPLNSYFYQYPHSGKSILNIDVYVTKIPGPPIPQSIRGVARTYLRQQLIAGKQYCAKMFVNPFEKQSYFTNGMAFYFDNGQLDTIVAQDSSGQYPFVNPQVQCPFIVNDTLNWQSFSGVFTANGTEKFCTIGNFLSDSNTQLQYNLGNTTNQGPGQDSIGCYCSSMLVDDVSLIPVDISNWLKDEYCTINDSVYIGLPQYEVSDAKWYTINMQQISEGSGIKIKATQPVIQYIQAIDVCNSVRYDTLTVYAYPLQIDNYAMANNVPLQVYPNPAKNSLTVEKIYNTSVSMYNVYGKLIATKNVINNAANFEVSALPKGMYVLKAGKQWCRVVVE